MALNAQAGDSQAYSLVGASLSRAANNGNRYQPQYHNDDPQAYGHADHHHAMNHGSPAAESGGVAKAVGLLGAVASLALIVGIGVWGYKLVARDVSGVPVVRSLEGPMRIQPDNPGGRSADNQGLAVNAVAAHGTAADPADRLTLAPASMNLTEDDVPVSDVTVTVAPIPAPLQEEPISEAAVTAFQNGEIDALVAELTEGVTPLGESVATLASVAAPVIVQPTPLQPVETAAITPLAPSPAVLNAPGVKVSLRPLVRPARASLSQGSGTPIQGRSALEVEATSLAAGTRLAQLGAYESAAVARAEWERIFGQFGDYFEGKSRVIQKAESGGRTFYRLRAMGFDDLSDARRFCATLVAGKADCIPVTTR
ncbi:SPOR domain-containing protein [Parasedimentitalea maritima]|uniref:SPOR domain-containing protein n=1 Tax=Parasedimentitalea maritima TaxID=2578117 RepID=A0ABY2UVH2_9RHOB|nr:SPOR domain-containing protein [Zongyanglinia marina]TLP64504.1 SPOR domain-containing protein [Zongyanglinia marina]